MKRWQTIAAGVAAVAVVSAGAFAWWWWSSPKLPDGILEGYGRIEATEVTVSAKVSGRIAEMPVREGDRVRKGDLLAVLSAEEIGQRAAQAESRVGSAEAQLRLRDEQSKAELKQTDARLTSAREHLQETQERVKVLEHHAEQARTDFQRDRDLVAKGFISERQLSNSESRLKQAEGELTQAKKLVSAAEADVEAARAARDGIARETPALLESAAGEAAAARAARAEVGVSQSELRIVAPSDGTIITKAAEVGELLSPGKPLLVLGDLERPYLRVYLPERDIGKVKLGDAARVFVDSFPGRPFEAVVTEVANKAEFTPKDVHMPDERVTLVYAVKLEINSPQGLAKPGMPADGRIRWKPDAPWGK